ncbi:endothelial cell-specific chemotaxis regulator isoform X7 [Diceros bicornis minor]|uniref:endothelial cell-specific chemotaxis regulator isoform X7 n=1 Tax=Diceros bicornis minor TaxID=77932 RepID=UPI0026ED911A|nr:endothelial cell-specific chemotaxis regulator isoform X7 [Diceros bicornis minor]
MGTVGAMQCWCWVILGFLLLQGHNSQPSTTQPSSPQGYFSSLSLTIKPTSLRDRPSSETNSPSLPSSTSTPADSKEASQASIVAGKPLTPRSSSVDGHSPSLMGLTPSQTQKLTSGLGVISFIVILVVVVIVLVGVVSLRFKCRKNKESEDPQKPGTSGLTESCSTANGEKDSITLISMKNINMNNSKGRTSAEKVL